MVIDASSSAVHHPRSSHRRKAPLHCDVSLITRRRSPYALSIVDTCSTARNGDGTVLVQQHDGYSHRHGLHDLGTFTLNVDYGAEYQRGDRLLAPDSAWLAAHTVFP